MPYDVDFYHDARGKCDVEELLRKLRRSAPGCAKKCRSYMEMLEEHGAALRRMGQYRLQVQGTDRLWELRPERSGTEYRFLYAASGENRYVILNGFKKVEGKRLETKIEQAKRRLDEMEEKQEL